MAFRFKYLSINSYFWDICVDRGQGDLYNDTKHDSYPQGLPSYQTSPLHRLEIQSFLLPSVLSYLPSFLFILFALVLILVALM